MKLFFRYLFNYIKSRDVLVLICILVSLVISKSLISYIPIALGGIYDEIGNKNTISTKLIILASAYLTIIIVDFYTKILSGVFIQDIIKTSSISWMNLIFSKDFSFFEKYSGGRVSKIFDRGLLAYESALNYFFGSYVPLLIQTITISFSIYSISNHKIYLAITLLAVISGTLSFYVIKLRRNHLSSVNDVEDNLAENIVEAVEKAKQIKHFLSESLIINRMKFLFYEYSIYAKKLIYSSGLIESIRSLSQYTLIIILLFDGAQKVSQSQITVGELIATISLSILMLSVVDRFVDSYKSFDQFKVDLISFNKVLNFGGSQKNGKKINAIESISIKTNNMQIEFKKGEKIALLGRSGSGKSTLLRNLTGLYNSDEEVSINGINVNQISDKSLNEYISYSDQDAKLLSGRFSESVFFETELKQKHIQMIDKLKVLNIDPHNWQYDPSSDNISGGEKRRLALSRCLLKKAELFLLDEPTSEIDNKYSQSVWDCIFEFTKGTILVCATHDISNISMFDKILVISDKQITFFGDYLAWKKYENS